MDGPSIGKVGGSWREIIHIGEHQSLWDPEVEGRDIIKETQGRDGGDLRGPKIDRGRGSWCALANQHAAALSLQGSDPGNQVIGDPAVPEDAGQSQVIDVIKASLEVQKEGGHLKALPLHGFHVLHEGEEGIVCAQPRRRAALVRLNKAP